jgi:hypothetical protein
MSIFFPDYAFKHNGTCYIPVDLFWQSFIERCIFFNATSMRDLKDTYYAEFTTPYAPATDFEPRLRKMYSASEIGQARGDYPGLDLQWKAKVEAIQKHTKQNQAQLLVFLTAREKRKMDESFGASDRPVKKQRK